MASFNKVILMGNVGRVDVKQFPNGSVAELALCTNEQYKNRNGEAVVDTDWHTLKVSIQQLVSIVEKYVKKGDLLLVEGRLKYRKYTDKDGANRSVTEVHVTGIQLMPKTSAAGADKQEPCNPADMPDFN